MISVFSFLRSVCGGILREVFEATSTKWLAGKTSEPSNLGLTTTPRLTGRHKRRETNLSFWEERHVSKLQFRWCMWMLLCSFLWYPGCRWPSRRADKPQERQPKLGPGAVPRLSIRYSAGDETKICVSDFGPIEPGAKTVLKCVAEDNTCGFPDRNELIVKPSEYGRTTCHPATGLRNYEPLDLITTLRRDGMNNSGNLQIVTSYRLPRRQETQPRNPRTTNIYSTATNALAEPDLQKQSGRGPSGSQER